MTNANILIFNLDINAKIKMLSATVTVVKVTSELYSNK